MVVEFVVVVVVVVVGGDGVGVGGVVVVFIYAKSFASKYTNGQIDGHFNCLRPVNRKQMLVEMMI